MKNGKKRQRERKRGEEREREREGKRERESTKNLETQLMVHPANGGTSKKMLCFLIVFDLLERTVTLQFVLLRLTDIYCFSLMSVFRIVKYVKIHLSFFGALQVVITL